MIEVRFSCLKCGTCCRSLQTKHKDYYSGLFLFPKEVKKLRQLSHAKGVKLTILPQQGVTTKIKKHIIKPDKIISYQLADSICPFLDRETNRCTVYDKRPVTCRAFPILTPSPMTFIQDCVWVRNNVPLLPPNVPMSGTIESLDDEIRNASRITNWLNRWLRDAIIIWTFDLQTKRWISIARKRFV